MYLALFKLKAKWQMLPQRAHSQNITRLMKQKVDTVMYMEIQVAISTDVSDDSVSTLASEVLLNLCKCYGYFEGPYVSSR